jgi:hypothetical protein
LYHYDRAAGQLIGVTGVDNGGLSGLEQKHRWLRGRDGFVVPSDALAGRVRRWIIRAQTRSTVEPALTIDADIQSVVEEN